MFQPTIEFDRGMSQFTIDPMMLIGMSNFRETTLVFIWPCSFRNDLLLDVHWGMSHFRMMPPLSLIRGFPI